MSETKKSNAITCLINGLITENPTFVLMLGMCPTLAVTTSLTNAIGMGISTTVVLVLSNGLISLLRNIIPDRVRIPAYIVIVASLVTIVELLIKAFVPSLYSALGIYIPLIVVNCIILGRAEAFAAKNNVVNSLFDGLGMGLGFTVGISLISIVRELLGNGSFFGINIIDEKYHIAIFVLAPGAFFVLAVLCAIQNKMKIVNGTGNKKQKSCSNGCLNCSCHNND